MLRSDAGKDRGQQEKGTTEDEMFGWHHRHNGHGFGWTLKIEMSLGKLWALVMDREAWHAVFMGSQ